MKLHQFLKKCDEDWKPLPKERMERQAQKKQDNLDPQAPVDKRAETLSQIKTMDATRNFLGSIMPQLFPEPNKKSFPAQKVFSKYMDDAEKVRSPEDFARIRAMNQVHRLDYQGNKPVRKGERERQADYNMADRMMKRTQSAERAYDRLADQKASLERLLDPDVEEALTELPKLQREKLIDAVDGSLNRSGAVDGIAEMLLKTLDNRRKGNGEYADGNLMPNRMLYALLEATEDNGFDIVNGVSPDMMKHLIPAFNDIFSREGNLEETLGVSAEEFEQAFGVPVESIHAALDMDPEEEGLYDDEPENLEAFQALQEIAGSAGSLFNRRNQDTYALHRANNEMSDEMRRTRSAKIMKDASADAIAKLIEQLDEDEREGLIQDEDPDGNPTLYSRANPMLLKHLMSGMDYDDVLVGNRGDSYDGGSFNYLFQDLGPERQGEIYDALESIMEDYKVDYARSEIDKAANPYTLLNYAHGDFYGHDDEFADQELEAIFDTMIKQGGGALPHEAAYMMMHLLDPNEEGKRTAAFSRESPENIMHDLANQYLHPEFEKQYGKARRRPQADRDREDQDDLANTMGGVMEMIEPMLTSGQPRTPELEAMLNYDGSDEQYGEVFPEEIRNMFENYMLENNMEDLIDHIGWDEEELSGYDATHEDRFSELGTLVRSLQARQGSSSNKVPTSDYRGWGENLHYGFPQLKMLRETGVMDQLKRYMLKKIESGDIDGEKFRSGSLKHLAELMQRLRGMYPSE